MNEMNELKRIVCVDDDPDILLITDMALGAVGGLDVVAFDNPWTALTGISQAPPDVVLLDVMMPELDGPAVLRELRRDPRLSDLPVIFMTARVRSDEIDEYLSLGAVGIVAKPFDPMTLAAEVRRIYSNSSR